MLTVRSKHNRFTFAAYLNSISMSVVPFVALPARRMDEDSVEYYRGLDHTSLAAFFKRVIYGKKESKKEESSFFEEEEEEEEEEAAGQEEDDKDEEERGRLEEGVVSELSENGEVSYGCYHTLN